jgi:hypothetical protein
MQESDLTTTGLCSVTVVRTVSFGRGQVAVSLCYFCRKLVINYFCACTLGISCCYQTLISIISVTTNLLSYYLSLVQEVFPDAVSGANSLEV